MEVAKLLAVARGLAAMDAPGADPTSASDAVRIDRIRALEVLKAAASAAQARTAAALDASQRRAQAEAGVPTPELGRGVAAQVALARRDSPHRGGRHLGMAKALVAEMPCTLAALEDGRLSEWRATVLVRETAVLSREDRAVVDAEVAGDAAALERLGDRALAARARQVAYRLDPRSVVARARRAESERRVTVRPAPDTMAYLTALLPVAQAVAVVAALGRCADTAHSDGDPRGRGQVMADTLVAAVTGTARAADRPGPSDASVRLVMTDRALLDGGDEPVHLDGYGPLPSAWARDLLATTLEAGARVFVRRVLTDAVGSPVAMDSRSRLAPAGLAELVRTRDGGTCRTPWCDAPARHVDHVVPHARGGPTSLANSQGLCVACNLAKEAPGWRAEVRARPPDGEGSTRTRTIHTVETTTPTSHVYTSCAPALPGWGSPPSKDRSDDASTSPVETLMRELLGLVA